MVDNFSLQGTFVKMNQTAQLGDVGRDPPRLVTGE
jgi:hypothetical protein